MRRPLVAGNWKLHGSGSGVVTLADNIRADVEALAGIEVALCPTFVHLPAVGARIADTDIELGAQDVSDRLSGPYTGEVAPGMLAELGCHYAIVGHSERRARHGESSEGVAAKCNAALQEALTPILCLGETLAQRDSGETWDVVLGQLDPVLALGSQTIEGLVIAYEPVWAIGTGRTATPEQAQEVHAALRRHIAGIDAGLAERTRLVYGGSVKPANAAQLFAQNDIDGALVGGASLDREQFAAICRAASN